MKNPKKSNKVIIFIILLSFFVLKNDIFAMESGGGAPPGFDLQRYHQEQESARRYNAKRYNVSFITRDLPEDIKSELSDYLMTSAHQGVSSSASAQERELSSRLEDLNLALRFFEKNYPGKYLDLVVKIKARINEIEKRESTEDLRSIQAQPVATSFGEATFVEDRESPSGKFAAAQPAGFGARIDEGKMSWLQRMKDKVASEARWLKQSAQEGSRKFHEVREKRALERAELEKQRVEAQKLQAEKIERTKELKKYYKEHPEELRKLYNTLELEVGASPDEIEEAYSRLRMVIWIDRNKLQDDYKLLKEYLNF